MSLSEHLRQSLRKSPAWVSFRRVQREGMQKALKRWRLWSRILETPPILTEKVTEGTPVELHLLCYKLDYLCAIWALKSFYHFAGVRYPLVIHLQGDVPDRAIARLQSHFPFARLVPQALADELVERWLSERDFVRLLMARRLSPFMLKLTDFNILSRSVHLLTLDTDLIFFRRPAELLGATHNPSPVSLFQRDPQSTYNLSEHRAQAELGIQLAPRINTGIMLFPRDSLDLSRCEELLAHPDLARPSGWIEQTLYALCASEQGRVAYLPDSYLVSLTTDVDVEPLVVRHYAGPSRPLLTKEGMSRLIEMNFLEQLSAEKDI